jgi:hypothetical protein
LRSEVGIFLDASGGSTVAPQLCFLVVTPWSVDASKEAETFIAGNGAFAQICHLAEWRANNQIGPNTSQSGPSDG